MTVFHKLPHHLWKIARAITWQNLIATLKEKKSKAIKIYIQLLNANIYGNQNLVQQLTQRVTEIDTRIHSPLSELFLNPEQLVVFGEALTAAGCTRLDFAGLEANDKVSDE